MQTSWDQQRLLLLSSAERRTHLFELAVGPSAEEFGKALENKLYSPLDLNNSGQSLEYVIRHSDLPKEEEGARIELLKSSICARQKDADARLLIVHPGRILNSAATVFTGTLPETVLPNDPELERIGLEPEKRERFYKLMAWIEKEPLLKPVFWEVFNEKLVSLDNWKTQSAAEGVIDKLEEVCERLNQVVKNPVLSEEQKKQKLKLVAPRDQGACSTGTLHLLQEIEQQLQNPLNAVLSQAITLVRGEKNRELFNRQTGESWEVHELKQAAIQLALGVPPEIDNDTFQSHQLAPGQAGFLATEVLAIFCQREALINAAMPPAISDLGSAKKIPIDPQKLTDLASDFQALLEGDNVREMLSFLMNDSAKAAEVLEALEAGNPEVEISLRDDLNEAIRQKVEAVYLVEPGILIAREEEQRLREGIAQILKIEDADSLTAEHKELWAAVLTSLDGMTLVNEMLKSLPEEEFQDLALWSVDPGCGTTLFQRWMLAWSVDQKLAWTELTTPQDTFVTLMLTLSVCAFFMGTTALLMLAMSLGAAFGVAALLVLLVLSVKKFSEYVFSKKHKSLLPSLPRQVRDNGDVLQKELEYLCYLPGGDFVFRGSEISGFLKNKRIDNVYSFMDAVYTAFRAKEISPSVYEKFLERRLDNQFKLGLCDLYLKTALHAETSTLFNKIFAHLNQSPELKIALLKDDQAVLRAWLVQNDPRFEQLTASNISSPVAPVTSGSASSSRTVFAEHHGSPGQAWGQGPFLPDCFGF